MRDNPFALAIDGSHDSGLEKMNPVTVRIFDPNQGHAATRFLDMCLTSGSGSATAAAIFKAMDGALQSRNIPWVTVWVCQLTTHLLTWASTTAYKQELSRRIQLSAWWDAHVTSYTTRLGRRVMFSEMYVRTVIKAGMIWITVDFLLIGN